MPRKKDFFASGRMASGHLPLVHTHNSNLSIMIHVHIPHLIHSWSVDDFLGPTGIAKSAQCFTIAALSWRDSCKGTQVAAYMYTITETNRKLDIVNYRRLQHFSFTATELPAQAQCLITYM